jgi:hypothetical protein
MEGSLNIEMFLCVEKRAADSTIIDSNQDFVSMAVILSFRHL